MSRQRKRTDGRFERKITIKNSQTGVKKRISVYASSTEELTQKVNEIIYKQSQGLDVQKGNGTFAEWATAMLSIDTEGMKESELSLLKARVTVFTDQIGAKPISTISKSELQEIVNEIYRNNPHTHKKSSKRTVQRYIVAVGRVFRFAIGDRAINFNPAEKLKNPSGIKEKRGSIEMRQIQWITQTPHRAQTAAMLMLYAGLRRGEVTALRWSDIDFEHRIISITKSFDFKTQQLKEPKTDAGKRNVHLCQKLYDYLQSIYTSNHVTDLIVRPARAKYMSETAWKRMLEQYLLDLDIKYGNHSDGYNKFNPRKEPATITPFKWHMLRHTFCTMLHAAGIDVLVAQREMGHAKPSTTMDIYTHLDQELSKPDFSDFDTYCESLSLGDEPSLSTSKKLAARIQTLREEEKKDLTDVLSGIIQDAMKGNNASVQEPDDTIEKIQAEIQELKFQRENPEFFGGWSDDGEETDNESYYAEIDRKIEEMSSKLSSLTK